MSKAKTKAPEQTFEEVKYLRHLIDEQIPVRIRLSDNEEVVGVIDFFDAKFIRVTRMKLVSKNSTMPCTSSLLLSRMQTGTSLVIKCRRYFTSSKVCSGALVLDLLIVQPGYRPGPFDAFESS